MFKASILICAIAMPNCVTLEDTRGPYVTRNECVQRVDEMVKDMAPFLPPNPDIKFKCARVEGEAT
jgi:hypothetical protein